MASSLMNLSVKHAGPRANINDWQKEAEHNRLARHTGARLSSCLARSGAAAVQARESLASQRQNPWRAKPETEGLTVDGRRKKKVNLQIYDVCPLDTCAPFCFLLV